MNFVVYSPREHKDRWSLKKAVPSVKLSNASIVINKAAREMLQLNNGIGLELAFDPEERVIRIAPGGGVTLRQAQLGAKGFFDQFAIRAKGAYPAEINDGALYVRIG